MFATSPAARAPAAAPDRPRVLLVEDDRSTLALIESRLETLGYAVTTASHGAEAFAMLRENPGLADIVMTDRTMPFLDGLGLTRRLKRERDTRHLPVIILTGASETEDVSAGIEAGAFYYLTKPPAERLLASVLGAAMQEVARQGALAAALKSHHAAFPLLQVMRFTLRQPAEVEPVASMLASMHDEPSRTIHGIFELVQNAVEHGVLRFGFEAKARLLREGRWAEALARRAADPAYAGGSVEATAMRREDGIYVSVKDDGPGFNWKAFLASDPTRSGAACGRGISRAANFSFDKLSFDQTGNQAVGFVARQSRVAW
ncbi:hypothetical protein GCM10011390_33600 [Aureimonas endophytica]|uniref:Response regulatory domain-containing protein n=1 Tax=Aureimonas endophytica TaxID=2027858 RepID=A0A916ZSF4_9HYPH|nr:response regulator [Aureimonas endophytica]GGE11772.1 hypothetical protein GCM10011390_33600 [Aureimonas endophytica]